MLLTPEHEQLRDTVRRFVERELNPFVDRWEAEEQFPAHEVFKKAGNLGLLGVKYDAAYGGLGLDFSYSAVVAEALGHCKCGGVPMAIGVQSDMATPALHRFGSDELKRNWLAPTIAGDMVACLGVSEPGGGSDVAAIKTTARKDGGDYVISGSKMWITNGLQADWCCLLANTSEGKVHQNKSLIVVPMDAKGIAKQKIQKLGMFSSDTAQLFFDDVRVPQTNVIGQEGAGFMLQMLQFQEERLMGRGKLADRAGRADRRDHRLHAPAQGLRASDPGQPGGAFPAGRASHRGRGVARADLERDRTVCRRQRRGAPRVAWRSSNADGFAARLRILPAILGRHGLHLGQSRQPRYRDGRLVSIGGGADEVMLGVICKLEGTLPGRKKD